MKKLLLSFAVAVLATASAYAQCTPGAAYPAATWGDSIYGVWPDTVQNLPSGTVAVAYNTDLNFKAPSDASLVDPAVIGTINDFTVDAVNGLPPGITYACNQANCAYVGDELGCANVSGTPTTSGTYEITIDITANVDIGFGIVIPVTETFSGYRIEVGNTGTLSLTKEKFEVYPNPANSEVTINGLEDLNISSLEIVNMAGATVKSYDNVNTPSFNMNIAELENGMYFIKINHEITELVKFIKK
jgi:hypothetical protein